MTKDEALRKIATVNAMDYEYQAWAREALAQPAQEPVREALKLALDDIAKIPTLTHGLLVKLADVEAVINEALAQPAQEPVAWRWGNKKLNGGYEWRFTTYKTQPDAIPLYAAPPQRPWVGLTEEDFSAINQSCLTKLQAATSAESILKEKNNG